MHANDKKDKIFISERDLYTCFFTVHIRKWKFWLYYISENNIYNATKITRTNTRVIVNGLRGWLSGAGIFAWQILRVQDFRFVMCVFATEIYSNKFLCYVRQNMYILSTIGWQIANDWFVNIWWKWRFRVNISL